MTPPLTADEQSEISAALVLEVKAELGRRDLSSRALGRMIGKSSQYMSTRLDGGNPRTGERIALTVWDIAAIASALGTDASVLLKRAEALAATMASSVVSDPLPTMEELERADSAAAPLRPDVEGDEEPPLP